MRQAFMLLLLVQLGFSAQLITLGDFLYDFTEVTASYTCGRPTVYSHSNCYTDYDGDASDNYRARMVLSHNERIPKLIQVIPKESSENFSINQVGLYLGSNWPIEESSFYPRADFAYMESKDIIIISLNCPYCIYTTKESTQITEKNEKRVKLNFDFYNNIYNKLSSESTNA